MRDCAAGEQKSGSTWLWEMLNAHPCLLTAAQPYKRMGAITTKETYYFTSTKIGTDGRELLVPWLGYSNASFALTDEAWQSIGDDWFERARVIADKGTANSSSEYFSARTYVTPPKKLAMQPCTKYYILEGGHCRADAHAWAAHLDGDILHASVQCSCTMAAAMLWWHL